MSDELSYVARAIEKVATHFAAPRADGDRLGIIGFCGAPWTLASYMIEGGKRRGRNYIETKKLMYSNGRGLVAADGEDCHGAGGLRAAAGGGGGRCDSDLR